MSWSEERLHRWLHRLRSDSKEQAFVLGSIGNDAAVLRRGRGSRVLCVDQTMEEVHFEAGTAPGKIGRKAVDRVLSDLAASAARPQAILVGLSAPRHTPEARLRAVLKAARERARSFGAELVGGDLAAGLGPLALAVTGVGELRPGQRPIGRDRARVGDWLALTGPCGGSLLGRHLRIEPRLEEGVWLAANGVRAMMDVSDGLGRDAGRMARASGVRFDLETLPIHPDARRRARLTGRSPEEHALCDGEDHELLISVPSKVRPVVERGARTHCPGLTFVGRVRAGRGVRMRLTGGWESIGSRGGWVHGG